MEKVAKYLSSNNIALNGIALQVNETGYHIIAEKDLEIGQVVATIPKESILSVHTTAIADTLSDEQIGGILGLTLAVAYESRLETSPWYEYLHFFAIPVLPFLWDDKQVLEGTDVGRSVDFDLRCIIEDYESIKPTLKTLNSEISVKEWIAAHCIVSSRAFWVDAYHGEAIVPLADIFNHQIEEDVHFESVDVCEECGGVDCACGMDEWEDESDAPELEDSEVPELEESEVPELEQDEEELDASILEMVCVKPVQKGQQVFNTYGKLSNSMLLRRYGFVIENNPHSTVKVDREEVLGALKDVDVVVERVAYWDQVGKDILEQLMEVEEGCSEDDGCCDENGVCSREVKEDCCDDNGVCSKQDDCCDDNGICEKDAAIDDGDQEWEDEEDMETDSEFIQDDFCFERKGPSYALLLFTHFLVMSDEEFERVAMDLEAAIHFFMAVKNEYENGKDVGKGKGKLDPVKEILDQVATNRIKAYPTEFGNTSEHERYAKILRDEELEILNYYL